MVQLAVVHAQFEILHPFLDGNGRLGRILIPLFLFEKKILHRPMFYLSAWLEARRDAYIDKLRQLGPQSEAWNEWIEFFLKGLEEQARINSEKAQAILMLYSEQKTKVLALTHSQFAVPLLDQIFERPIFKSSHLKFGERQPSRPAIAKLLRSLRDGGVISVLAEGKGSRATIYIFSDLINLCEPNS